MSFLFQHNDPPGDIAPAVLPIIGGAAVGKKTLVAHACGDERVRSRFSSVLHLNGDSLLSHGMTMFGVTTLVVIEFASDVGDDDCLCLLEDEDALVLISDPLDFYMRDMGDEVPLRPLSFPVTLPQLRTTNDLQFLQSSEPLYGAGQGCKARTCLNLKLSKSRDLSQPLR